jgi:hypothetical protein
MSKKHKQSGVNYRKIYESHHGKIPKGYHIHHIDGNPFNNEISNLQCVSPEEHAEIHKNEFTKWASVGGKKGGNLTRDLKLGFHSGTEEQKSQWAKNAASKVDRKKHSEILKEGYESGRIVNWTKLYSKEEVHRRISEGDPGKSTRGKSAWNRGKKMKLSDPELARQRKSEAALKKKKVECPNCNRLIDISNIGKHLRAKHNHEC